MLGSLARVSSFVKEQRQNPDVHRFQHFGTIYPSQNSRISSQFIDGSKIREF